MEFLSTPHDNIKQEGREPLKNVWRLRDAKIGTFKNKLINLYPNNYAMQAECTISVTYKNRCCEQQTFSSLFESLFLELQPFQLNDSQLGFEVW